MKRDMNLVRKILLQIEETEIPGSNQLSTINIKGYNQAVINEHLSLINELDFFQSYKVYLNGNTVVKGLTNKAYDFLELIRNKEVWEETNKTVKEKKLPQTIEIIGKVAAAIAGTFMREFTRD